MRLVLLIQYSSHIYISNYSIIYSGAGTQNTTLTIPGDPVLNGTVVHCNALGIINNELYDEADSDALYIQSIYVTIYNIAISYV